MYIYRRFNEFTGVLVLSYGYPTVILRLSYGKVCFGIGKGM